MQKGFSLIEIIIVVAIIGVIAAIAIPAYNGYVKRTNRTAVQAEMMRISQDLQRYQAANRNNFDGATLATVNAKASFPEGKGHYTLALRIIHDPKNPSMGRGWELTATPASPQQNGDGSVMLNHRGEKCRVEKENSCTLSAISKWD